jgi:glycosyltransferase involved in cell wall biosynthesis
MRDQIARATMRRLCVEGWRFLHHSYALVNQWQLLSLLKRNDLSLTIRDAPCFQPDWTERKGLFTPEQERQLESIPVLAPGETPDATLRISYPFDFSLEPKGRTVLFATSEYKVIEERALKAPPDIEALSRSDFVLVTPSRWSREGILGLGLRDERIVVVPHGVDCGTFRPSGEGKAAREAANLPGFTFANLSAMTTNKGIDLLLRAFAVVVEKHPGARLLLKGSDDLYQSESFLMRTIRGLPEGAASRLEGRIVYAGNAATMASIAIFYQLADAYVSPYRGEGFNLPVLEASACGTPVICTKGGSTDDFMNEDTARFIESRPGEVVIRPGVKGFGLEPDLDHLIHLMLEVMEDREWRERARRVGPSRAATEFSWDLAVDKLLRAVF